MKKKIEFKKIAQISREDLKKYSIASGDYNEIHLNDSIAQKHNLPGVIAHGMLIAGFISSRATEFIYMDYDRFILKKSNFRFKAMTFPGEEIFVGGFLEIINENEIHLDLDAINNTNEIKTVAHFIYKCG